MTEQLPPRCDCGHEYEDHLHMVNLIRARDDEMWCKELGCKCAWYGVTLNDAAPPVASPSSGDNR